MPDVRPRLAALRRAARTRLLPGIAAALLAALVAAPCRPAAAQELGWSGSLEGSANLLFGAARGRLAAALASASRADSALEVRADAQLTYADSRVETDGDDAEPARRRVTARASRLSLGLDHRPFARVSPFWFGSTEANLQQRIARRWSSGAGAKWTLRRVGDDDLSTSLALLWERTRALEPDSGTRAVTTRARWSLRVRVRQRLTEALSLSHVTFYQPTVDRPERWTADSNTSLLVAVTGSVALTATFRERYDSEARRRGARSNHDGQLLFGVKAAF